MCWLDAKKNGSEIIFIENTYFYKWYMSDDIKKSNIDRIYGKDRSTEFD